MTKPTTTTAAAHLAAIRDAVRIVRTPITYHPCDAITQHAESMAKLAAPATVSGDDNAHAVVLRDYIRCHLDAEVDSDALAHVDALAASYSNLEDQVEMLATVLMDEFGGPIQSESACEMAVRVLQEQAERLKKTP